MTDPLDSFTSFTSTPPPEVNERGPPRCRPRKISFTLPARPEVNEVNEVRADV